MLILLKGALLSIYERGCKERERSADPHLLPFESLFWSFAGVNTILLASLVVVAALVVVG